VFSVPGANSISVYSFSHGADGTIALAGAAFDAEGRGAPLVAWIKPFGQSSTVVRTDPYNPKKVTIASDGTVWTVGSQEYPGKSQLDPNAGVFRHWDQSGKLIGSYVPQAIFANARQSVNTIDRLVPAKNGVAWFSAHSGQYFEISSTGK